MTTTTARPCVLLVDDNPMVLRAMGMLLDSVGWDVFPSGNAEQALAQLKWRHYDMAIVDLRMPETNGIELCRQILNHDRPKKPVLLIHSGYIDEKSRALALDIGVDGVLDKPLGRDELIAALQKYNLPYETQVA